MTTVIVRLLLTAKFKLLLSNVFISSKLKSTIQNHFKSSTTKKNNVANSI